MGIKEWEKLKLKVKNCKKCDLWKTRKNVVFGEGNLKAKILILGQAPGSKEDEEGRPFVGRAGRLLDNLLRLAGLKREEVFITSVLKCFPPKNRPPAIKEIKSCLYWLKEQVRIINLQKIILLRRVAFSIFFPKENLKNFRGKWIEKGKKFYFPTYHPAAGLPFPTIKKNLRRRF